MTRIAVSGFVPPLALASLQLTRAMPTPRRLPISFVRPATALPGAGISGRRYISTPTPPARRSVVDSALIAIAGLSITGFLLYKTKSPADDIPLPSPVEGYRSSSFTVTVIEQ